MTDEDSIRFNRSYGEDDVNNEEDFDDEYADFDGNEEDEENEREEEDIKSASQISVELQPKTVRDPFKKDEIMAIMKKEMENAIQGKEYSQENSKTIVGDCTNQILNQIHIFGEKYFKYITHSLFMPVSLTKYKCYSLNMWEDCDDFVTVEVTNESIRFIMTVWGVNCY